MASIEATARLAAEGLATATEEDIACCVPASGAADGG
jgi:hypothetical protein